MVTFLHHHQREVAHTLKGGRKNIMTVKITNFSCKIYTSSLRKPFFFIELTNSPDNICCWASSSSSSFQETSHLFPCLKIMTFNLLMSRNFCNMCLYKYSKNEKNWVKLFFCIFLNLFDIKNTDSYLIRHLRDTYTSYPVRLLILL